MPPSDVCIDERDARRIAGSADARIRGPLLGASPTARLRIASHETDTLSTSRRRAERLPLVIYVLALGTFLMGTSEFVAAGLLPAPGCRSRSSRSG
jgi:hypothetical protein